MQLPVDLDYPFVSEPTLEMIPSSEWGTDSEGVADGVKTVQQWEFEEAEVVVDCEEAVQRWSEEAEGVMDCEEAV